MPDLKEKKNKHMTFDDRLLIQEGLTQGMTFKAIAERIGKDQTTVSKEIRKHITVATPPLRWFDGVGNPVEASICPKLMKAPFVCNGCDRRRKRCAFGKHLYVAKNAQKEYEALLVDSREGIPLNKEEFYELDKTISNGINQGQHLYHIMQTHDLGVSKSTVYRHLKRGYLSVAAIDFPRVVKFKPRKQRQNEYVPKALKEGRTYEDFIAFTQDNGISSWVEMDTVIGRIGGKVILTLDFTFCNFMVGLLLDNKASSQTSEKLTALKMRMVSNHILFGDIFPLILTDNGGEFSDVFTIENDLKGQKESCLFFCDPYKSCQKPRVEKNHTMFRDIVPQGNSFDTFKQTSVNLIFSHINSVKRKSLNGKTPFELFTFTYGEQVASLLGISAVPPEQVIQSPKLLSRLMKQ